MSKNSVVKKVRKSVGKKAGAVSGRPLATLGNGVYVIRTTSRRSPFVTRLSDRAGVLVQRIGKALAKPGISKRAVFGDSSNGKVYAYYVHSTDPTRVIRESVRGKRTIGRVVGGRFRAG